VHKKRIIARLDIKNDFVIKGIQMDGLRKVGDPNELAREYYSQGADEIIFLDAVASYYDRNSLFHIIERACESVFIPMTVGGGLRSIEDIQKALNAGADKVAINTMAVRDPSFIERAVSIFGSQCIVASVVAKQRDAGSWVAYVENGRESSGLDVIEWVVQLEQLGVGELILTSLDRDGTKKGFDLELCSQVRKSISIPLIISGGAGMQQDVIDIAEVVDFDAVALGTMLHYKNSDIQAIKKALSASGVEVRL
jgi:cyclase